MNNRESYLPYWGVVAYLVVGVGLSIFGPFEYANMNEMAVFIYMFGVLVSFTVGYFMFPRSYVNSRTSSSYKPPLVFDKIFRACLVASVIGVTINLGLSILKGGFSLNIMNSGQSYLDAYSGYERNQGSYSLVFLFREMLAPAFYVFTILGMCYYNALSKGQKICLIYVVVVTLLVFTVAGGKQKQFGDVLLFVVCVFSINKARTGGLTSKFILTASSYLILGLAFLCLMLGVRYSAVGVDIGNLALKLHPLMGYRDDNIWVNLLGDEYGFPFVMLSSYLSQGYYGLALTLDGDFTWTYFLGSSYTLSVIANKVFGVPFMYEHTYPYLVGISSGWGETKWYSIYSWLASDFTFVGTMPLIAFFGSLYRKSWYLATVVCSPLGVLVFCLLSIAVMYSPANNQLLHTPGSFFTVVIVFFLWFKYR